VRDYGAARIFSTLAHSLLGATFAWHVYDLSASAFGLALLGLVNFLPVIPASLLGGALADSRDRRAIVSLAQGAAGLATASLALATLAGHASLGLVLGTAFAVSLARAFESPAGAALLPSLVPRELFPSAVVVSAIARNLGWMSGPVASGLIAARAGLPAAYASAVAGFALSIALLVRLRVTSPPAARSPVSLRSIREGIAFVRAKPVILAAMTLDMFAVIFAGSTALLPIYAREILGVGLRGYGLLAAALSIGTSAMTVVLLLRRPVERPGRALLAAVAAFGLATIAFGLSRSFALSVAALVVAGMADEVSMVARQVLIQLSTPDALRGRVSSVNLVFIGASNELGGAESGVLAGLTSPVFAVVFGGAACLGVLGVVAWRVPALRRYRVHAGAEPG
jgi:MFS family permease